MILLLSLLLAYADDPAPPVPAAPAEVTPAPAPPVRGREVITITAEDEVLRRRAEVFEALTQEGYIRRRRQGDDRTVFLSEDPWKPQVVVHDDGWVYFRRQPPRVHAPGKSFADQGSPAAYLLCIIAPTACVSVGGWLVSDRKLGAIKGQVMDSTQDKIRAMNDAVARRELGRRLNEDIPADLDKVWARTEIDVSQRKVLLYAYWDSRTETPEGEAAKEAITAWFRGVVQTSDTPFTAAELATLNETRASLEPLQL